MDEDETDAIEALGDPNCPRWLTPMDAIGDAAPRWDCPDCGLTQLA